MEPPAPSWRAFEANEISHSGAHYLLAIASAAAGGRAPRAADIARQLGITRAAVSLQLRALVEHGLVALDGEQRIHLSGAGEDLVARVASKREVVTVFLRDVLGVRGETAEGDACKVEHLLSEEAGAALVRLIRFCRSAHPAAAPFVAALRATTADCPPTARCELCTSTCLLAAGAPPSPEARR